MSYNDSDSSSFRSAQYKNDSPFNDFFRFDEYRIDVIEMIDFLLNEISFRRYKFVYNYSRYDNINVTKFLFLRYVIMLIK